MNILFITDLYPLSEDEFNTPRVLKDFVEDFKALNHNVQIIRPNFILNSFVRRKTFQKTGVYNEIFNVNYFMPFLFDVKNKLRALNPYDIIVSHMPSGNIFANKLEGKHICGIHNSDLQVLTQPLYSIYFKNELLKSFRNTEKLICRSFSIEKKLLKLYPEFVGKTIVITSGIDEKLIISKIYKPQTPVKILTCANLIKRKNIDKLILAVKNIENIELTVIGNGKELKKLKKLDEKIIFKGNLKHEKVLEEMRKSDIFILPSIDETLGMVYLEAMASGCITIGTENEGIDGIINDGFNGFLTKPDINSIRATITKICNLSDLNLSKICENSHNTISKMTTTHQTNLYLEEILKSLVH